LPQVNATDYLRQCERIGETSEALSKCRILILLLAPRFPGPATPAPCFPSRITINVPASIPTPSDLKIDLNKTSVNGPLKPALPVTISAWIGPENQSGTQVIFSSDSYNASKYAGDVLEIKQGGVLCCGYGDGAGGNSPS